MKSFLKLSQTITIVIILIQIFFFNYENAFCCIVFGPEQLEMNLCRNKVCPNYGRCKIDENGFFAKCYCPKECDEATDAHVVSITSDENVSVDQMIDTTVCGTDGRDYKSSCELQRESCLQNREVRVAFQGKCSKLNLK